MVICSKCNKKLKNLLALNGHKRTCWYNYNNKNNHNNGRGKYHTKKVSQLHVMYNKSPRKCKQCCNVLPYKSRKNTFCNKTCSAKYNNTYKTTGTRRSKLEVWIQDKLQIMYPTLQILFNNRDIIQSELDIYIPDLKLAFELNGIFHYEPIYGEKSLNRTQLNDKNKFYLCITNNIDLCVIDTSQQKYFKEQSSYIYLNIITDIINSRL